MIGRLIDVGLDVARLNFSHGTHAAHQAVLNRVREAAVARGLHLPVLGDLCGPKLRIGPIAPGSTLASGAYCTIRRGPEPGNAEGFGTNCPLVVDEAQVGHRVLIDDGLLQLRVTKKTPDGLSCVCEVGGPISSAKGLILPDTDLSLPALTEKDKTDVAWAIAHRVDYLALSFVRRAEDVTDLRDRLNIAGANIPIVSKIETPQAISALDEIIAVSDALLVARGDLGVTTELTGLPILQKDIIQRCARAGRPVIVATQMLQSMISQPTPTRAEVSDVANAVFDGADAVMLSAETASGAYPVEALTVMNRITERIADFERQRPPAGSLGLARELTVGHATDPTTAAVARSAVNVASDLDSAWIAVWCRTGTTATWISKYRPRQRVVGLSADVEVCRRLGLVYGVTPFLVTEPASEHRAILTAAALRLGLPPAQPQGEALVLMVGNPQASRREPVLSIHRLRPAALS